MRKAKLLVGVGLAMVLMVAVPGAVDAQSVRIGVINTNQVLGQSAAGQAAGNEFNTYATEQQQPLLDLEAEINVKAQQLEAQQLALSETAIATRTAELDRLQRNFTRGQEDLALELEAKQAEVLQPVYELANSVIEAYAAEAGFQMIIDPTAAQGILVFLDPALDVTAEVISRMDEAYAAGQTGTAPAAPAQ